jgi:hypothetical protein
MTARLTLLALSVFALALPARADHDAIDQAFAKAAPEVITRLKARNCKAVGVLKFMVQKGDSRPDDMVGELNQDLADRLEAALIIANPDEKIGIIRRAGPAVAEKKNRLANHLTTKGRQALFADDYPLAWGSREVRPGAFVTGRAEIAKDLRKVTLRLEMFGEDGQLEPVGEPIEVPTSLRTLVEAGYSYVLAGAVAEKLCLDGARGGATKAGRVKMKAEDDTAATATTQTLYDPGRPDGVRFTAADALRDSPVKLTMKVNNAVVGVEGDRLPEPRESDEVVFELENTDPNPKAAYAVVLKVNGKNTLFSEEADATRCLKWILGKGAKVTVRGFQEDEKNSIPFRILSAKESEKNLVRYGDLAGTVRMVVFRGEQVSEDPSAPDKQEPQEEYVQLAAVARGYRGIPRGEFKPGSLTALKADLLGREKALDGMRGVIDKGGDKKAHPIERVHFKTLPTVGVADITIRYYSKK